MASSDIRVRVLNSAEELCQIREPWNELFESSQATVFQSYEWVVTWWKHYGRGHRLHVILVEKGEALIGIAPLFEETICCMWIPVAKRLRFIGSPLTEYTEVLARGGHEAEVFQSVATFLSSNAEQWDVLMVDNVTADSTMAEMFPQLLAESQISVFPYRSAVSWKVELPSTWEEYLRHLGHGTRYNLKRDIRKLEAKGPLKLDVYCNPDERLANGVEDFFSIYGNRWRSLGYDNVFDLPAHRSFMKEMMERFAERGWLHLYVLRVGNDKVASSLEFHHRSQIYLYYANAHGTPDIMQFSPGLVVKMLALEKGITSGMRTYDMLRGEHSYKSSNFKAQPCDNWQFVCCTPSSWGRVRFRMYVVREMFTKGAVRVSSEYHTLKRLMITKRLTFSQLAIYILSRPVDLFRLTKGFIGRHLAPSAGKANTMESGRDKHKITRILAAGSASEELVGFLTLSDEPLLAFISQTQCMVNTFI